MTVSEFKLIGGAGASILLVAFSLGVPTVSASHDKAAPGGPAGTASETPPSAQPPEQPTTASVELRVETFARWTGTGWTRVMVGVTTCAPGAPGRSHQSLRFPGEAAALEFDVAAACRGTSDSLCVQTTWSLGSQTGAWVCGNPLEVEAVLEAPVPAGEVKVVIRPSRISDRVAAPKNRDDQ